MVYLTHPVLLALIALPLVIYYLLPSGKRSETPIRVPTIPLLKRKVRRGSRSVFISAFLTFAALVLAAARPVQTLPELEVRTSGHNFVLAVDLSASMTLGDMQSDDGSEISRIDAVKAALARFISLRPDDRIALEAFGDHAYMMSPLTSDHELLLNFVKELEPGLAGALSSTGEAISLGVTTLARQTSGGKGVIILVSDGRDTVGATPPARSPGELPSIPSGSALPEARTAATRLTRVISGTRHISQAENISGPPALICSRPYTATSAALRPVTAGTTTTLRQRSSTGSPCSPHFCSAF